MTGLKRGAVAIIDHQAEWADIARDAIAQLREIFGSAAVDIQHIGSTAIRGISAKPIIDIAVGVRDLSNLSPATGRMCAAGYRQSVNRFSSDLLYVRETPEAIRTHQIHILIHGSEQWHNYVDFRDYMNAFPGKAKEYEALKQRLVLACGNVQSVYTDGKAEYMRAVLAEAKAWQAVRQNAPEASEGL